jgi:hypothetical protein
MLFWKLRLRNLIFFDANDGAGPGGGSNAGGNNDGGNAGDNGDGNNAGGGNTKTFNQEDVDRIVSDRLKREKKTWESTLEEERRKAAMTEAERLKAKKEAAEKASKTASDAANSRVIKAESRVIANELGVKADKLSYVLKLADLSNVTIGDDGEPNTAAIRTAIEAVLKDIPELKGANNGDGKGGSGGFGGQNSNDKPLTAELIGGMDAAEIKRRMPEIKAFFAKK